MALIIRGIYFLVNCIGFSVWLRLLIRLCEVRQNLISLPTNYVVKKAGKQFKKHCESWGVGGRLEAICYSPYANLLVKSGTVNLCAMSLFSCYSRCLQILVSTTVTEMWVVVLEVRLRSLFTFHFITDHVTMFDHFCCFILRLWMWLLCICSVHFNYLW